jgi:hypothetical protein
MKKSPVFEETYNKYLSHISDIDLLPRAARLGAELAGDALIIPYYEKPFRISIDGVFDETAWCFFSTSFPALPRFPLPVIG